MNEYTIPESPCSARGLPSHYGLGVDKLRAVLVEWDARFFSFLSVERPLPRCQLTPYSAVGKKAAELVGDLRSRYMTIFAAYAVAMAANQAAEDWYSCHTNKFSSTIDWEHPPVAMEVDNQWEESDAEGGEVRMAGPAAGELNIQQMLIAMMQENLRMRWEESRRREKGSKRMKKTEEMRLRAERERYERARESEKERDEKAREWEEKRMKEMKGLEAKRLKFEECKASDLIELERRCVRPKEKCATYDEVKCYLLNLVGATVASYGYKLFAVSN